MELDRQAEDVHHIFRGENGNGGDGVDCCEILDGACARVCDTDSVEGSNSVAEAEVERQLLVDNIQLQTMPKGKESSAEAEVSTPAVGMTYESWEQIDLHFRCYAKQNGFAVCRVGAGVRQKNGIVTKIRRNVTWKCEMWGVNKFDSNSQAIIFPPVNVSNTRSRAAKTKADSNVNRIADANAGQNVTKRESFAGHGGVRVAEGKSKRCNCPVMLYAKASVDGSVWTITKAVLQHEGHDPSPWKSKYIPAYKQEEWNPAIRRRLFNDLEYGIKIPQIYRGLARERGGVEKFSLTQRDLRNEVTKKTSKEREGGDANAVYTYLRRMAEDNDQFFL